MHAIDPSEPDLKAVLFLGGPAELQLFVCDVRQPAVDMVDGFGLIWRYKLHPSKHLGPEGWVAEPDESKPVSSRR